MDPSPALVDHLAILLILFWVKRSWYRDLRSESKRIISTLRNHSIDTKSTMHNLSKSINQLANLTIFNPCGTTLQLYFIEFNPWPETKPIISTPLGWSIDTKSTKQNEKIETEWAMLLLCVLSHLQEFINSQRVRPLSPQNWTGLRNYKDIYIVFCSVEKGVALFCRRDSSQRTLHRFTTSGSVGSDRSLVCVLIGVLKLSNQG